MAIVANLAFLCIVILNTINLLGTLNMHASQQRI